MPNQTETPRSIKEFHTTPEGRPVETYANGRIKVYGGHDPKTLINLPEFNTHIIIHKFGPFEFNREGEVDAVLIRKQHHKSKLAIAFNPNKSTEPYAYDVLTQEGPIGIAFGQRLDLLIASFYYDDEILKECIQNTGMDERVKKHLQFMATSRGKHAFQP